MKKNIKLILLLMAGISLWGKELPFVIIIPSYNNERWCEKNLLSALQQHYENYYIIYINDCSTDQTYDIIKKLVNSHPRRDKVILINNSIRCGALENLYNAIHTCPDYSIIVTLDGDDWLAHSFVLNRLNKEYSNPDVWMTYGSYLSWPSNTRDSWIHALPAQVVNSHAYRKYQWVTTHLRTFYAKLFKLIKKEDLLYNNLFFPMAGDLAFMFPMLEMAANHSRYIEDILYIYNRNNPISDNMQRNKQRELEFEIRKRPPYNRIEVFLNDIVGVL